MVEDKVAGKKVSKLNRLIWTLIYTYQGRWC